jgi:glycosyltransferase involved in cell wall biosynthesis
MIGSLGVGGAERFLVNLARRLPGGRFDWQLVCISHLGVWGEALAAAGSNVVSLGKRRGLDPLVLPRLVRQVQRYRPHVVNTHLWTADLWGRLAARLAGVPVVVVTEQNVDLWKGPLHHAIDRALLRWTDAVVCVSEEVERFYCSQGVPAGKRHVIPNAIDLDPFDRPLASGTLRAETQARTGDFLFVSAARLHPQKAQDILLGAARRLVDGGQRAFRLAILGDGPKRRVLEELARARGLSGHVRFLGERQDVPGLLRQADGFVLSSLYEGLPLALLEAMAARLPVVATRVGGCPELVSDGETGFLVPPADEAALAWAMDCLIRDPAVGRAMGEAGRRLVEAKYRIDHSVERTASLFESLLATRGLRCG